jgi:hypothetical protein
MWLLAALAAGMNYWHGATAYGPLGGAGLALSSLLGIGLWEVTAGHLRHTAAALSAGQVRTTLLRWVRFPRLALAAASLRLARGAGAGDAWAAAWVDRYGVDPDASRRDRRLARLVIREQWRTDRDAAKRGELTIVSGVILRALPAPSATVLAPTQAGPQTGVDGPGGTPGTAREMRKLSPGAAALLPKVRDSIAAGNLPGNPSAKAIRTRFGGAMTYAMEVRDHLAHLHAADREDAA